MTVDGKALSCADFFRGSFINSAIYHDALCLEEAVKRRKTGDSVAATVKQIHHFQKRDFKAAKSSVGTKKEKHIDQRNDVKRSGPPQ